MSQVPESQRGSVAGDGGRVQQREAGSTVACPTKAHAGGKGAGAKALGAILNPRPRKCHRLTQFSGAFHLNVALPLGLL